MGADGGLTDHAAGLEQDRFDAFADHLILCDLSRPRMRRWWASIA